jgi:anti-sigma factor RsiW
MRNDTLICGRENDLIGFLYGELNQVEASAFQRHLKECPACNAELADLGEVRESVVAWRNESLGSVALPTQVTTAPETPRATPSAVAALREFFNLSPLWMKGAVAVAAVLFFVFAGLAVARLRAPSPAIAVAPAAPAQSQQDLKALVEQGVQEELKRLKNSEATPSSPLTARDSSQRNLVKRNANRNTQVVLSASSQKARRPLTKTEREQLASDLRLVSAKNDGDLDLLDDRINQ